MIQITNEKKNKLMIAGAFASVLSLSIISANMEPKDICKAKAMTAMIVEADVLTKADIRSEELLSLEEHSVALSLAVPESIYDGKILVNLSDTDVLNIRMEASEDSEIVGKIYGMSYGDLVENCGEWTKITSGEVTGFVKTEYILTGIVAEEKAISYGKEITKTAITKAEYDQMLADYAKAEEERKAAEQAKAAQNTTATQTQQTQKTQETTVVESTTNAATYDDEYLLACLIEMEAGGECYEGKLAVGAVVVNRRNSGAFGSTIYDVIYAKGQFPGAHNGLLDKRLAKGPSESCRQAAREALAGVNNIGNLVCFNNVRYANYSKYKEYVVIGNHVFYR
ncbi:MAG: cell wall hydrolase [Lachnospiraceae bacterium]|nr:cell wall hydrolase [Lachnospiraceae bacterium]